MERTTMNNIVKEKIAKFATQRELAVLMKTKQQNISRWINSKFPPERVIPFCELMHWEITPHELRPDLHPTPVSGIPGDVILPSKLKSELNNHDHP
ncbi:helix-turn-helix domain-containing protein [Salmonella enterica subsp. enterica]|nr:helix-turn-helix domain-containing protein [Salmonella enterica]ELH8381024.1 helix-turn-helix domain-containing protein [Salmonella enterica subsp. enterica]